MRMLLCSCLLVVAAGCQRQPEPAPSGGATVQVPFNPNAQAPPDNKLPAPTGGLVRRMQLPEVQNYMRNLGIAYKNFEAFNNRGPRDLNELAPQFENNPKMVEALSKGWWKFIYNANRQQMTEGPSNTIIAYEAQADNNGVRVVVMGDGTIRTIDEATFKKTPKAR